MNAQQIAQLQNQLLSVEEIFHSEDHRVSVSMNGHCKIQDLAFAENMTLAEIKSVLPPVINQGLTLMGNKVQQIIMMQQQMS
jgi:DNA-binding protein YbaB